VWPGKPQQLYGKPYDYYEIQGEPDIYDISELYWRHDWRDYFLNKLKLPLLAPLTDIGTLEDRIAAREAYEKWEEE